MSYIKTVWVNNNTPAINADNLNKIEQGIYDNATTLDNILNTIYPVGSIIIKDSNTDYSSWLGFEWEKVFNGKVLVGQDIDDTDFDTIGETGGEKTHTLTKTEIPKHNHKGLNWGSEIGKDITMNAGSGQVQISSVNWSGGQAGRVIFTGTNDEGGSSHNNLQPYQVVAYWKRTA